MTTHECPCGIHRADCEYHREAKPPRRPVTPNWRAVIGPPPPCKPECPYCKLMADVDGHYVPA